MAELNFLNDELLKNIAKQVGKAVDNGLLRLSNTEKSLDTLQIAEGFPIWILLESKVSNNSSFDELFQETNNWYFQIQENNTPKAFITGEIDRFNNSFKLASISTSSVCENIDKAITILDKIDMQGNARLLEIPAWLMTCLWIVNEERPNESAFFIVSAPHLYSDDSKDIYPNFPILLFDFYYLLFLLQNIPKANGRLKTLE